MSTMLLLKLDYIFVLLATWLLAVHGYYCRVKHCNPHRYCINDVLAVRRLLNSCIAGEWVQSISQADPTLRHCNITFSMAAGAIRIGLQHQHMIRDPSSGDRQAHHFLGTNYRCKYIHTDMEHTVQSDIIVVYAEPHITALDCMGYKGEAMYIPPMLRDFSHHPHGRDYFYWTTVHAGNCRRNLILDQLNASLNGQVKAVHHPFQKPCIGLDKVKILDNIHQYHNVKTLETNRLLPALMRGVVVVSESVPFVKLYGTWAQYIVFADYANLVNTTLEVGRNYDYYFNKFFGPESKLKKSLHAHKLNAYKAANQTLHRFKHKFHNSSHIFRV